MPVSLSKAHRKLLENTTADARVLAESACRAALENLAVHEKEYRGHMTVDQRKLRNRLRARGRAIGDARDTRTGLQDIHHLTELAAYEHWHRLLFTRFLTENHLLITDEANGSVPITLEECEELAPELGARDGLDLACRFASRTLPVCSAVTIRCSIFPSRLMTRWSYANFWLLSLRSASEPTMLWAGRTNSGRPNARMKSTIPERRLAQMNWHLLPNFLPRITWWSSSSTTPSGPGGPARLDRSTLPPSKKRERKRHFLRAMACRDLVDVFAVRAGRDDQDLATRGRHV